MRARALERGEGKHTVKANDALEGEKDMRTDEGAGIEGGEERESEEGRERMYMCAYTYICIFIYIVTSTEEPCPDVARILGTRSCATSSGCRMRHDSFKKKNATTFRTKSCANFFKMLQVM